MDPKICHGKASDSRNVDAGGASLAGGMGFEEVQHGYVLSIDDIREACFRLRRKPATPIVGISPIMFERQDGDVLLFDGVEY